MGILCVFCVYDTIGNRCFEKTSFPKMVKNWPTPKCSKDVERFAGLANYHRVIVKNFSELAAPVGKRKFQWGLEQEQAFQGSRQL